MSIARHGQKTVKLESLKLPGDIRDRMKAPHVRALSESYKATGGRPMNAPWVDKETGRLVAGRDRVAALMVAGIKETPVEHVSGDPIDLARATIIENFHRRLDDRQKLAKQLAEIEEGKIEKEIVAASSEPPRRVDVGRTGQNLPAASRTTTRPKETKTRAIEKAAEELHITPAAARGLVRRAEEKEKAKESPAPAPEIPAEPQVKTFGRPIPAEVGARIDLRLRMIDEMSKLLVALAGKLTAFEYEIAANGKPVREHRVTEFREPLELLAHRIRAQRPVSLCPYCKVVPEAQKTCGACRGMGFVRKEQMANVHPVYLAEGDKAIISLGGKEVSLLSATEDDF